MQSSFRCLSPIRTLRCGVLLGVLVIAASVTAHAQLIVRLDAPTLTYNPNTARYDPYPIPVTFTVINTGAAATLPLSVRIELIPPMTLDTSEHSVTMKNTVPAIVPPGDSAHVTWMVDQPAVLSTIVQRLTFYLHRTPTDSTMHGLNLIVPGAGPAQLVIRSYAVSDLHVRPDSLGYLNNPFPVRFGFLNSGGTDADSVRVSLHLPTGCVLDPPGQANPIVLPVLQPVPIGDPRLELSWTVRYTGATRRPQADSLVISATALDTRGQTISARDVRGFSIDGMAPACVISITAPPVLQYDSAAVYAPDPVPVSVTLTNPSMQDAPLRTLVLRTAGDGVALRQGATRMLSTLAAGDTVRFSWDADVLRAAAPRTITFDAVVTDGDTVERNGNASLSVPGKPWSLDIAGISAPDTIALTATGTDYVSRDFTVRYRARNGFWSGVTVVQTRMTAAGTGVSPNAPIIRAPGSMLAPGASSEEYTESFRVIGGTKAESVPIDIMAVSSAGDTGTARIVVFIPALTPRLSIRHSGPDTLTIDPATRTYRLNPFEMRFTIRNDGSSALTLDSLSCDVLADGVTRTTQKTIVYNTHLAAGGDATDAWIFSVDARQAPRTARVICTASFDGTFSATDTADVFLPGFEPELSIRMDMPSDVSFDSISYFRPNPIHIAVVVVNTGAISVRGDSLRVTVPGFPLLTLSGQAVVALGTTVAPGDSLRREWDVAVRDTLLSGPFSTRITADAWFDTTRNVSVTHGFQVPGRVTALLFDTLGIPDSLTVNAARTGYNETPLVVPLRLRNDAWVRAMLDTLRLEVTGVGVQAFPPAVRAPDIWMQADGLSPMLRDTFIVAPSSVERVIDIGYTAASSLGHVARALRTVRIPAIVQTGTDAPAPGVTALGTLYPNPSPPHGSRIIIVPFTLGMRTHARLDVYSLLGTRVAVLADGDFETGASQARWNAGSLPAGLYFIRLSAAGVTSIAPVSVR